MPWISIKPGCTILKAVHSHSVSTNSRRLCVLQVDGLAAKARASADSMPQLQSSRLPLHGLHVCMHVVHTAQNKLVTLLPSMTVINGGCPDLYHVVLIVLWKQICNANTAALARGADTQRAPAASERTPVATNYV